MSNAIKGYIFDLDCKLYDFGGVSFSESKLGVEVKKQYFLNIEQYRLGDPNHIYKEMVDLESTIGIGISQQIADKLGITRGEVLQIIWGEINPNGIVENIIPTQKVIPILKEDGKALFLVTAAPRIWAIKALEFMTIKHYFNDILTLEDYGNTKKEAFTRIQLKTDAMARELISIGDQIYSDIIPAQELGMQALHVTGPKDLLTLL